jgi:hypothetical protein
MGFWLWNTLENGRIYELDIWKFEDLLILEVSYCCEIVAEIYSIKVVDIFVLRMGIETFHRNC